MASLLLSLAELCVLCQGESGQDETLGNLGEMGALKGGKRAGYGITGGTEGILPTQFCLRLACL